MNLNKMNTKIKMSLVIITLFVTFIIASLISLFNGFDQFLNNWFLVSLTVIVLVTFRLLFEQGAYDAIIFSTHKVRKSFGSNKQAVVDELASDDQSNSFNTINDYIDYRMQKRSKKTTYIFIGAFLSLMASILSFFI